MKPRLTQAQREQITAALFRQEPYSEICAKFDLSERSLRRMVQCLRTYGTTMPPGQDSAKPMGRPRKMNAEIVEGLRQFVETHPLANLKEIQAHLQQQFQCDVGRSIISRRLREMGYSLSIISRGATSVEKDNLPLLTREDTQRLLMDPNSNGVITTGSGNVYAWLRTSTPVPRRLPAKKTTAEQGPSSPASVPASAMTSTPAPVAATAAPLPAEQRQNAPLNHESLIPGITEAALGRVQGQAPPVTDSPSLISGGESTSSSA